MSFVHLHLHTEYSLLDGACRISKLPQLVKDLGQNAVAITDHGVMYGAVDFYKACKAADVKPIIGCEVYVAPRSHVDKVHGVDNRNNHLILLCKNQQGYKNLSYLVSTAFTHGYYIKPRIDLDLLSKHCEGLIALSACIKGSVPQKILNGDFDGAKEEALYMQQMFGEDSYYLEIQDHGIPQQKQVFAGLCQLHEETGIPLVATNDAHYLTRQEHDTQDIMMCISMGKSYSDPNRMKFTSNEFYVKTEEEMRNLFLNYPEAIDNTQKIADLCNFDFEFGVYHLPSFPLPSNQENSFSYLTQLCQQGFEKRYENATEEYKERLQMELDMIHKMGFVDYFLIVSDFIAYARNHDIPVGPGRGSAAGSMVSYCLRITDVDPMEYNLYFERFLNPERISMPDIDIDFCTIRRGEVIDYVIKKYGQDHVSQIITFGTMGAKSAIRDTGRVMDVPLPQVDTLAKQIPPAIHITLNDALEQSAPFRESYNNNQTIRKLVDTAISLEGTPRNSSIHAAGVVITNEPVYTYVPLSRPDKFTVTQFTMTTLEELGLLKMDFLALRNLTVIHDAELLIRKRVEGFSMEKIALDDAPTMKLLADGKTSGVFQVESAGMSGVCMDLKPQNIEDITAILALYRPGPMDSIPRFVESKHNPSKITYKHPSLEKILSVTYGCIVYQEQVLEIFRQLAGYSLGQADMMRRAISKKKAKEIEKERKSFISGDSNRNISGCVAADIPEKVAESIFEEILDFADYAFNKSHAVCYAVVAYQTAWLKCHYPKEYMSALLTSVLHNKDKIAEYIKECKAMGIPILPPDINQSSTHFTATEEGIRFGLVAIAGVGQAVVERLLVERKEGLFQDFYEFCERMHGSDMNKRALESLIRSGCFDGMKYHRAQLVFGYSKIMDEISENKRKNLEGQFNLFDQGSEDTTYAIELPDMPEYTAQEKMKMEKETTGLYLNGHPMDAYFPHAHRLGSISIFVIFNDFHSENQKKRFPDGQPTTIAGVITMIRNKITKNNTLMAYITLEDDTGAMELVAFSQTIEKFGTQLYEGNIIAAMGKISMFGDKEPQLKVDSVVRLFPTEAPSDVLPYLGKTLFLRIPEEQSLEAKKLQQELKLLPGENPLRLYFEDTQKQLKGEVFLNEKLFSDLVSRFGVDNVKALSPSDIANLPSPYEKQNLYLRFPHTNHPFLLECVDIIRRYQGSHKVILYFEDTQKKDLFTTQLNVKMIQYFRDKMGVDNVKLVDMKK